MILVRLSGTQVMKSSQRNPERAVGTRRAPSEPHPPGLLDGLCLEFFPHGAWVAPTGFHPVRGGFTWIRLVAMVPVGPVGLEVVCACKSV